MEQQTTSIILQANLHLESIAPCMMPALTRVAAQAIKTALGVGALEKLMRVDIVR